MRDDNGVPGHLEPIYSQKKWLDYLFQTELSAEHKLVGTVIANSCTYSKAKGLQLSMISIYSITRIVKLPGKDIQKLVEDLFELGWLFDTGRNIGARKIYALTMSLLPLGAMKQ